MTTLTMTFGQGNAAGFQGDSPEFVEKLVRKVDSSIQGRAEYLNDGWHNRAYAVGDHVVRFPKSQEAYDALCREERFCQYVLAQMPHIETPDLAIHEIDGRLFSLHRRVGSGLFTRKKYESLTGYEKDETAQSLAVFFMLMHETPISYAEDVLGATKRTGPSCFERMARIVDEKLDPGLKEFGHSIIREYQAWNAESPQLVFGHFDLHDGNVGADANGKLAGVFDFADCAIGDVHADFAPLFYISPDLVNRTVPRYEELTGKAIDARRITIAGAMCEISDLAGDRASPEPAEYFNRKLFEWRAAAFDGRYHSSGHAQNAFPCWKLD